MDKTFSLEELVGPTKTYRERQPIDMPFSLWNRQYELDNMVDEIIEGSSGKFYDLERVYNACKDWDKPPYMVFPVGARGVGKTRVLLDLLMDAYSHGLTSIWTRNFESTFYKPSFYKGFLNLGKRLCGVPEEFTARPEGVYTDEKGGDLICTFKSINMGTELKGNEYRDVKYVLSDEFMVLPTERYPSGCAEKLGVMLDSLRTYADCCVMCSNFTYVTNPYWANLRIFPKKNEGVTTFKNDLTVIEVCERGYYNQVRFKEGDGRANVINKLQGGHDHASYEDAPNFELIQGAPYNHLSPIEFRISTLSMTMYFYIHNSGLIYVDSNERHNKMFKHSEFDHFVTDPKLLNKDREMINTPMKKWLKDLIDMGKIRFFNANVLHECISIIYSI